jgi:NAD(P)-dependent dehydrogenase (short-subunit alcohol dehydrogenase family)
MKDREEMVATSRHRELEKHVSLVIGGTRGIGWAICEALCTRGAQVVTCGTRADGVADAVASASRRGWSLDAVQADARSEKSLDTLVQHAARRNGHITSLVFCAGRAWRGDAEETSIDDWDRCLELNLRAPFVAVKLALPHLLMAGDPSIVFVSSIWAVTATRRRLAYSVAKAGLTSLTRNLAIDYGDRGLRVNAVAPGYIDTALLRHSIGEVAHGRDLMPEIVSRHPLGRIGTPPDIGEMVSFLVSPRSRFVTGQTIVVDGGVTAKFALADLWE